jgi:hypothetical protein
MPFFKSCFACKTVDDSRDSAFALPSPKFKENECLPMEDAKASPDDAVIKRHSLAVAKKKTTPALQPSPAVPDQIGDTNKGNSPPKQSQVAGPEEHSLGDVGSVNAGNGLTDTNTSVVRENNPNASKTDTDQVQPNVAAAIASAAEAQPEIEPETEEQQSFDDNSIEHKSMLSKQLDKLRHESTNEANIKDGEDKDFNTDESHAQEIDQQIQQEQDRQQVRVSEEWIVPRGTSKAVLSQNEPGSVVANVKLNYYALLSSALASNRVDDDDNGVAVYDADSTELGKESAHTELGDDKIEEAAADPAVEGEIETETVDKEGGGAGEGEENEGSDEEEDSEQEEHEEEKMEAEEEEEEEMEMEEEQVVHEEEVLDTVVTEELNERLADLRLQQRLAEAGATAIRTERYKLSPPLVIRNGNGQGDKDQPPQEQQEQEQQEEQQEQEEQEEEQQKEELEEEQELQLAPESSGSDVSTKEGFQERFHTLYSMFMVELKQELVQRQQAHAHEHGHGHSSGHSDQEQRSNNVGGEGGSPKPDPNDAAARALRQAGVELRQLQLAQAADTDVVVSKVAGLGAAMAKNGAQQSAMP